MGAESKKLPPPPNMFGDWVGGDRVLAKLSRPANAEGLGCGGAGCELKDKPLNASFNPPNADC